LVSSRAMGCRDEPGSAVIWVTSVSDLHHRPSPEIAGYSSLPAIRPVDEMRDDPDRLRASRKKWNFIVAARSAENLPCNNVFIALLSSLFLVDRFVLPVTSGSSSDVPGIPVRHGENQC